MSEALLWRFGLVGGGGLLAVCISFWLGTQGQVLVGSLLGSGGLLMMAGVGWGLWLHFEERLALDATNVDTTAAAQTGRDREPPATTPVRKPLGLFDQERRLAEAQKTRLFYRQMIQHDAPEGAEWSAGRSGAAPSPKEAADLLHVMHRWIRIQFSEDEEVWAFVYVDIDEGLLARGDVVSSFPGSDEIQRLISSPGRTIRLQPLYAWSWSPLQPSTQEAHQLPAKPDWYSSTLAARDPARRFVDDPHMMALFDPMFPGMLQVVVHDGGPLCSEAPPERVWVRVSGRRRPFYVGEVLNQPKGLQQVSLGQPILFGVRPGVPFPFQVKESYLQERELWYIVPCDSCGFDDLLDPPTRLQEVLFSETFSHAEDAEAREWFLAPCPICGGLQQLCTRAVLSKIGGKAAFQRVVF